MTLILVSPVSTLPLNSPRNGDTIIYNRTEIAAHSLRGPFQRNLGVC
jgi:hypothetical protein